MPEIIKIRKGLSVNLKGKAEKIFVKSEPAELYAVKPTDFHGLVPKLTVKVGDQVKAGSCLFFDKYQPDIKFTSPVSGEVVAVNRGERRKILEVVIKPDGKQESVEFKKADPKQLSRDEVIQNLLESGIWPVLRQRPFNTLAAPNVMPKAIFISAFDSAPLAPDYDFILQDYAHEFQAGIDALGKLTQGVVHLGINALYPPTPAIANVKGVQVTRFQGAHPAGTVGVQIHKVNPINKGEHVWTVGPQEVVTIGRVFLQGVYDASKTIALAGSEVLNPRYFKTIGGAQIKSLTANNVTSNTNRFISGDVFTGTQVDESGFLGYYHSLVSVIPEGNFHEFFGWLSPGVHKLSTSRTFLSTLLPGKQFAPNTNLHGGKRALMITGSFEKVFPFDIYPMQLIKAIIVEDIDLMEKLGIYEVTDEDFALCEFVDTSKNDIQSIVRNGLDLMIKEMS